MNDNSNCGSTLELVPEKPDCKLYFSNPEELLNVIASLDQKIQLLRTQESMELALLDAEGLSKELLHQLSSVILKADEADRIYN